MKERLLEEIQKGSKGAVMKKHIITYLISLLSTKNGQG